MTMADPSVRECVVAALRVHGAELRRYVRAKVPSADVDDVLQIAAMRAVEKAGALRDPGRVLPWLYRIHANAIADAARKRARDRRLIDAMAAEVEPVEAEAVPVCDCSIAQVRQLSPSHASILDLVDIGGASLTKAAQILGITVNNATVRLHRARNALKKRMLERCGVTSLRACLDCGCS